MPLPWADGGSGEAEFTALHPGRCANDHCRLAIASGMLAVRTIDGAYLHAGCAVSGWRTGYVDAPLRPS